MKHVILALLAGTLVAAIHQDEPKKSKNPLDGTWTVLSLENNGKKAPEKAFKGMKLIFVGDKLTIKKGAKTIAAGTFKLNAAQKPFTIDYQEGPEIFSVYDAGIIQVEGETLKYCTTADRKKRPTGFDSKQGLLMELKLEVGSK